MKSGFRTGIVSDGTFSLATCSADEASLNAPYLQNTKTGYLGERRVSFAPFDSDSVLIQGDMLVRADNGKLPAKPLPKGVSQGVGVPIGGLWPNGRIPFSLPLSFPSRSRVEEAIRHWNTALAGVVEFVPRSNESQYVAFLEVPAGCSADVGYQGRGQHRVNLETNCGFGNVVHELGHTIGLQHEQNRLDRDDFVTINFANVRQGYEANFEVDSAFRNLMDYDFGSIMHYHLKQFAKNANEPTIIPKVAQPDGVMVGQRIALSLGDINSVRALYGFDPISQVPDSTGNPIPIVQPNSGLPGIAGHYYQRGDFNDLRSSQLDPAIDFDWGTGKVHNKISGNGFSIRWKGWLVPQIRGEYQFIISSSGAFRVEMDGTAVFDRPANNEKTTFVSRFYSLEQAQRIRVSVEYKATGEENSIRLKWVRPDGKEEVIPASVFSASDDEVKFLENVCTNSASN